MGKWNINKIDEQTEDSIGKKMVAFSKYRSSFDTNFLEDEKRDEPASI